MNNQAKREYPNKKAARRAMRNKANYLHGGGNSGAITFGRIWCEDEFVYAESAYRTQSTLEDFLHDEREL